MNWRDLLASCGLLPLQWFTTVYHQRQDLASVILPKTTARRMRRRGINSLAVGTTLCAERVCYITRHDVSSRAKTTRTTIVAPTPLDFRRRTGPETGDRSIHITHMHYASDVSYMRMTVRR